MDFRFSLLVVAMAGGLPAYGADLVAIRPGLMCQSADALARLILPDGDSRTHAIRPRADLVQVAERGGCMDIPPGARVAVQRSYHNTSVVLFRPAGGPADLRLTVPNIDFAQDGAAPPVPPRAGSPTATAPTFYAVAASVPADAAGSVLQLLEDRRMTSNIQAQLWRNGRDTSFIAEKDLARDFQREPLRNAVLQLTSRTGATTRRNIGFPIATIEPAALRGRAKPTFFLTIDESASSPPGGGLQTEILIPSEHGLNPVR